MIEGRSGEEINMDRYHRVRLALLLQAVSLGVFVAWASVPNLATAQMNNEGLPVIPLNITNNVTSTPDLFVYITGILTGPSNTLPTGTAVYVIDMQGDVAITPAIPVGGEISLGLDVGIGTSISLMLPQITAIRIYLSLGNGLLVQTNNSMGAPPSAPCGWCGVPPTGNAANDANFNTIFDWAELAWVPKNAGPGHDTNLGGNVTEVDLFGLPLYLTFAGNDPAQNPGMVPITPNAGFTQKRPTIMNAYAALPSPWTPLLLTNSSGTRVRVISPYHGIGMGVFPANELDSYISSVWGASTLMVSATASCLQDGGLLHTFVGQNISGNMVFSSTTAAGFQFPLPSTLTVYMNQIAPSPVPTDPLTMCLSGVVAAKLGGALVRTVVLANPNLDACMVNQFYLNAPVQKYAQLFHQFGVGNLAYSFGYDDTCSQSSYITVDDPTAVDITISGVTP
jgi:hypothetical protein